MMLLFISGSTAIQHWRKGKYDDKIYGLRLRSGDLILDDLRLMKDILKFRYSLLLKPNS